MFLMDWIDSDVYTSNKREAWQTDSREAAQELLADLIKTNHFRPFSGSKGIMRTIFYGIAKA